MLLGLLKGDGNVSTELCTRGCRATSLLSVGQTVGRDSDGEQSLVFEIVVYCRHDAHALDIGRILIAVLDGEVPLCRVSDLANAALRVAGKLLSGSACTVGGFGNHLRLDRVEQGVFVGDGIAIVAAYGYAHLEQFLHVPHQSSDAVYRGTGHGAYLLDRIVGYLIVIGVAFGPIVIHLRAGDCDFGVGDTVLAQVFADEGHRARGLVVKIIEVAASIFEGDGPYYLVGLNRTLAEASHLDAAVTGRESRKTKVDENAEHDKASADNEGFDSDVLHSLIIIGWLLIL